MKIIGFAGYARSGKNTAAQALVDQYGFEARAFADPLREVLYETNPYIVSAGMDYRELIDTIGYEQAKADYPMVRIHLQDLGLVCRRVLGEAVWVKATLPDDHWSHETEIVVTDTRYPNEIQRIRDLGGVVVWVERPGTEAANSHESEHSIHADDCDYVILNDGGIGELRHQTLHLFLGWSL